MTDTTHAIRPRFSPFRRLPMGDSTDLLILSGVICRDADAKNDIEVQTRRVFDKISDVLKSQGASLADVVKVTSYLTDLADYDGFNRVRMQAFQVCPQPPASTAVGVATLLGDGTRVEIEAMAVVPRDQLSK